MTFPILIEVEDSALGNVLKMLNGYPGISKLHLDLDAVGGPRGTRKGVPQGPRKQRGPGEPTTGDIVIAFLMKSGPQKNGAIGDELASHGFSKISAPSALNTLKEKGIVHGVGDALWDLTDEARARLQPQAALPAPGQAGKTAHDLVLEKMKSLGGTAKRLELAQHLSANNLSAASINRVMHGLKERGAVIGDTTPGIYHLAPEKRSAAPAEKTQAKKPEADRPERGEKRTAIVKLLRRRKGPQSANDIAAAIGASPGSINGALWRLQQTGEVERVSPGMYQLTTKNAAEAPSTTSPQE